MTEVFLKIVNMSISASWLVLAVLALRLVFKKVPKWANVLLWGIVAVRLLFPFPIESVLSLIPSAETISPEIMTDTEPTIYSGVGILNSTVNPIISQTFAPVAESSVNPLEVLIPALACGWAVGVAVLLVYTAATYLRLRIKIGTAVRLKENVFQSESVSSPFVLGIIRPRIYLPFHIDGDAAELVLAHERAHIRRKDHLWKPLGFLLLTVYWFNPLMWIAYMLLCKDIELACDEKVIQGFDNGKRADYSQALLACSVNRRIIAACPLCFGEVSIKQRVKSVLNYKKPAFWIVVTSVIICIVVGVCFLTDPVDGGNMVLGSSEWIPLKEIPQNYTWMQASDDGCVVIYKKQLSSGEKIWSDFVNATYSGRSAIVRIYQTEGAWSNTFVKELSFDGEKYILKYYDNNKKRFVQSEYQYLIREASFDGYFNENYWLAEAAASGTPVLWASDDAYSKAYFICNDKNDYYNYGYNANYGSAYLDIDGDGEYEKCLLGEDDTADTPTFTLAVYQNKELEYYNTFRSDFNYLSFYQNENGKLMVREVTRETQPEIHLYDIVYTYGDRVELMENGEIIRSYR